MSYRRVEKYEQGQAIEIIIGNGDWNMTEPVAMLFEFFRYAGLINQDHEVMDDDPSIEKRVFVIHQPKHSSNKAFWIEANCKRIRSFGVEAYPIKFN